MNAFRLIYPALFLSFAVLVAWGCKNDPKPAPPPPPVAEMPPPQAKPDLILFAPWVNAKLRETPAISGKELAALTKGMLLRSIGGEKTDKRDSIVIQQIPMKEPWYRVSLSGDSAKSGWIFGGTLNQIWKGVLADAPDETIVRTFSKFTGTLDLRKPESAGKAQVEAKRLMQNPVNKATADCLLVLLRQCMTQMESDGELYLLTDKVNFTENDWAALWENRFDHNKYPQTKRLAENGFRVTASEGMAFPATDLRKLGLLFEGKISDGMREWIQQTSHEDEHPMWEDGGIIIPIEEVADRCVFWSRFNTRYPWFALSEETLQNEHFITMSVILGDDNSPSFDYETKTPEPAFKKAWGYILQKYPDTPLGKKVKEFTDLLDKEGGKVTPAVDAWIGKFIRLTNF